MSTLLRHARIPFRGNETRTVDILIRAGRFAAILEPGLCHSADEVVELDHALVMPGVVDLHVHFDDPGYTWRETFATGTRAAAAGGVTCVADMPCTSRPPVVNAVGLREKLAVVQPKAHVDFAFWGGICANRMSGDVDWRQDLLELAQCGVGAVKAYLLSGMDSFQALSAGQLAEVAAQCARVGLPLGVHAEDRAFVEARQSVPAGGLPEWEAWWSTRPGEAERRAAATVVEAARSSGAHLHVVHLGSGAALALLEEAQRSGLRISAETCPHYLAFTREDFPRLGSVLKTAPPVKEAADREALWRGVVAGSIAFISTDHAAGEWPREKQSGGFHTDYGGIPGVEFLLPWTYTHGVQAGRISLETMVERLCSAPARNFGLADRKGALAAGLDADFVVLDETCSWTASAAAMHCLNRYTPFEGEQLGARVLSTWIRGRCVYSQAEDAFPAGSGWGRYTRRHGRDHV